MGKEGENGRDFIEDAAMEVFIASVGIISNDLGEAIEKMADEGEIDDLDDSMRMLHVPLAGILAGASLYKSLLGMIREASSDGGIDRERAGSAVRGFYTAMSVLVASLYVDNSARGSKPATPADVEDGVAEIMEAFERKFGKKKEEGQ